MPPLPPGTTTTNLGELLESASLVVAGNLAIVAVPDVLSLLQSTGRDGEVTFHFPDCVKKVMFKGGNITFASSSLFDDRLGAFLVGAGRIDKRTFGETTLVCDREGKKFGRVLVERGVFSTRELYDAVRDQVEAIVMSLFSCKQEGSFVFVAREVPPSNDLKLSSSTNFFILEGVRMNDELRGDLEAVSDRGATFRPRQGVTPGAQNNVPGLDADVLRLLDGRSTVASLLAISNWSEANTLLAMARLLKAGVIEKTVPGPEVEPQEPTIDAAAVDEVLAGVSAFLRDVKRCLKKSGGDEGALDGYFDAVPVPVQEVFAGSRLAEDGSLDAFAVRRFLATYPDRAGEALSMLAEGLGDMVTFALWVAHEHVGEPDSTRLAEVARTLRHLRVA